MRQRCSILPTVALSLVWPAAVLAEEPATRPAVAPTTQAGKDSDWDKLLDGGALTTAPANQDVPTNTIDAASIRNVVKLSIKDKLLELTTDLPPLEEQTRVRIADFPGKTDVVNLKDRGTITVRHEISVPPSTMMIYMFSSLPGSVRLTVDSENAREQKSVQYIQNGMNDGSDPEETPVKLFISVNDLTSNEKTVNLKLLANDIADLRRKYPRETATYFQPMLAALSQDDIVFAVDHRTAWQVLSASLPIDHAIEEKVTTLVKQLDADEYAARESAGESLEKLGEPAALVVMRMTRAGLSSEQNSRLDAFLAPYKPLKDEDAKKYAKDVTFLLDCLYTDDPAVRRIALHQIEELTGRPSDLKIDASPTQWKAMVRQLRKSLLAPPTTQASGTTQISGTK
jgi:hypothetical protein